MANDIDLWNDLEDAEFLFGKRSKEFRDIKNNILRLYPELRLGDSKCRN